MTVQCPQCEWSGTEMGFASHWGHTHNGERPIDVHHTEDTKEKISQRSPGNIHSPTEAQKQSISDTLKGRKLSDTHKNNISKAFTGEKHPLWKGQNTDNLTSRHRKQIRRRDQFRCQHCGKLEHEMNEKLHIHHIDENRSNNMYKNLIALCRSCHLRGAHNVY